MGCDRQQGRRHRFHLRRPRSSRRSLLSRSEPDRNGQAALVCGLDCRRLRGRGRHSDVCMILLWLILIPLVAGIVAWVVARWNTSVCRWIALIAVLADFVLTLSL